MKYINVNLIQTMPNSKMKMKHFIYTYGRKANINISYILFSEDYPHKEWLISNLDLGSLLLCKLSDSEKDSIRLAVVKHKNITQSILAKLVQDRCKAIRLVVAQHPKTTFKTLIKLLNDPCEVIRKAVIRNPRMPEKAVIRNPRMTEKVAIRKSIKQDVNSLSWNSLMNKATDISTPEDILEQLSYHKDASIRSAVVQNSSLRIDIIKKLAEDENKYVRDKAKDRLKELDEEKV